MSAIQRSQSTPHFTSQDGQAHPLFHKQHQHYQQGRARVPKRTKTSIDFLAMAQPSMMMASPTPRTEREDPFNMGGFFPPSHLVPAQEEEWGWLHAEEEAGVEARTEAYEDDEAEEEEGEVDEGGREPGAVIRREDKMGILTLCT